MTRFLPFVALLALVAVTGCETVEMPQAEARGNTEEIIVITDSVTWAGPVGEALREELGRPIPTLPSNQGAFQVRFQPLQSRFFESLKVQPNLVFAAPIDAEGDIGDFLRARVGDDNLDAVRSGTVAAVNLRENLWSNRQLVTIATAASDSALATDIRRRGAEIRAAYERLARERTTEEMFSRLEQTDLEQALLDDHGFKIRIQYDYVQVQDTTATAAGREGTFVRYRRVLSDTWRDFFVFTQDGVERLPSQDALDGITNDLLRQFAQGSIDSSYVQLEKSRAETRDTTEIGGRHAVEQRGFWQTTVVPMGGSYVRYAFVDEAADRLYLYYGMTFAPDRTLDKRAFLRQMEAIGYTLRPAADVPQDAAAASP